MIKIYNFSIISFIYLQLSGFSQGAAVATRVLQTLSRPRDLSIEDATSVDSSQAASIDYIRILKSLQCVILIGGVSPPPLNESHDDLISLPSLHIIGEKDPFIERSYKLTELFSKESCSIITHGEDHRVPTMATQIYPSIHTWLKNHILLHSNSNT